MNLFDTLVSQALSNRPDLSSLRMIVEKELLHHDILRIMRDHNFLTQLTFIGGTCLRYCYAGVRLSEDLDFTGGSGFSRQQLSRLGKTLTESLQEKYGLNVQVSEPVMDKLNVDTWKIRIETRPEAKHMPAQRINIDICAVTSYDVVPMMLLNSYRVDMGTSGLILNAQSREEIYTDKLLAFAMRPNRLKYRDLWDIQWLHGQGVQAKLDLIKPKLAERHRQLDEFLNLYQTRLESLQNDPKYAKEFQAEMRRFLPAEQLKTIEQPGFWKFILGLLISARRPWGKLD